MEFLRELLHELHIDPTVILVNIIGFLILLALMRRFFFGPIGQFLAQRRQDVADTVDQAETDRQQAEDELTSIRGRQDQMMAEAQQQANQARQEADLQADEVVSQARQQALEREQQAEAQVREQQAQALAEARAEVAALSVEMAERVLRESLDEERQQALLEAALRDVEELARRQTR